MQEFGLEFWFVNLGNLRIFDTKVLVEKHTTNTNSFNINIKIITVFDSTEQFWNCILA